MKVEVEIDDATGEIVGEVPEPLDRIQKKKYDTGFGKGRQTAAEDAKKQIEDAIKAAGGTVTAADRERLRQLEEEVNAHRLKEAEREKDYQKAIEMREADHRKALKAEAEKREKREARIRALTKKDIRAAALEHGAREESLDELEALLITRIGFTDDMDAFVMADDGTPAKDGEQPLSIGGFVKAYLDGKPHHRKASGGTGGGAKGGATRTTGTPSGIADKDAAFAAVAEQPSMQNVGKALRFAGKQKE